MSEPTAQPHHKKKHRKAEPDVDPEFQIAPMIDILLVLLVFFMSISSTEVLQSNKEVNLPVAKAAKDAKENPGQVIINVKFNQINNAVTITVNERVYPSPVELIQILKNNVSKNPLVRVLIRADRDVKYDFMRTLLEAVGQAGIANVTFSVVDKDETAKPRT